MGTAVMPRGPEHARAIEQILGLPAKRVAGVELSVGTGKPAIATVTIMLSKAELLAFAGSVTDFPREAAADAADDPRDVELVHPDGFPVED